MILSPASQQIKAALYIRKQKMKDVDRRVRNRQSLDRLREARMARKKEKARLTALDHAQGMTVSALMEKYQVTRPVIQERLTYAEKEGLLQGFTQATINHLVPRAMATYEAVMSDLYHEVNPQVVTVATRVLEGTGVLNPKTPVLSPVSAQADHGEVTTLEEYRALRITRLSADARSRESTDIVSGTVINRDSDVGGVGEDSEQRTVGYGTVLDADQADPVRDVDGDLPQLPEGRDGGGEDPAGGDPQDQGRG